MDKLKRKIIEWCEQDNDIRTVIQTGSHTQEVETDFFSDLDISIFTDNADKFTQDDSWINALDKVWVYLPLKTDEGYPTRLVIFDAGKKVDFSFWPISELEKLSTDPSDLYQRGYKILVDKDAEASQLPSPSKMQSNQLKPSNKEVRALIDEFWFEVWHVAKHISRNDLWHAKWRDWGIKELTLRLIEWVMKARNGWDYDTRYLGVKMNKWCDDDIWQECSNIFAEFDRKKSLDALISNMDLFSKLSHELDDRMGSKLSFELEQEMTKFVRDIQLSK